MDRDLFCMYHEESLLIGTRKSLSCKKLCTNNQRYLDLVTLRWVLRERGALNAGVLVANQRVQAWITFSDILQSNTIDPERFPFDASFVFENRTGFFQFHVSNFGRLQFVI